MEEKKKELIDEELNSRRICFGIFFEDQGNDNYKVSLHYFDNYIMEGIEDVPNNNVEPFEEMQIGPMMEDYMIYANDGYVPMMTIIANYLLRKKQPNGYIRFGMTAQKYEEYKYDRFADFKVMINSGDESAKETLSNISSIFDSLTLPSSVSFIIEEPEQNLYPQTQVDVLKNIITCCNRNKQNSAVVTTHSPYVINYLNVLLRRPAESLDYISADELGVHLIHEGRLLNLMKHDRHREKWAVDSSSLLL